MLVKVCGLMKERSTLIPDLLSGKFFFEAPTEYDEKLTRKKWKENTPAIMNGIKEAFAQINDFSAENIEAALGEQMTENEIGFGQVGPGMRLLLTGQGGGPSIPEIASTIGKEETLRRMETGIEKLG